LKKNKPDIFKQYSMNGDYNDQGEKLLDDFFNIIYKTGFTHIKKMDLPHLTDAYLSPKSLDSNVENVIFSNNIENHPFDSPRQIIKSLPPNIKTLPRYCYYQSATKYRGEYFVIKNHPKLPKSQFTSTSKNISLSDKYNQMMEIISKL